MPTQYLNIHQAAAKLCKSTKTVRKYIKDGKLQAIKENTPYGSQYLIPLEAITSILNKNILDEKGMEALPEVTNLPSIPTRLDRLESLLLGMEASRQEYQQKREDRLLEAIERLEARVEEMSKKKPPPFWRRWFKL